MRDLSEIKINRVGRLSKVPSPNIGLISRFEYEFGVSLPEDYIKLLMYCNGGHPELDLIDPVSDPAMTGAGIGRFFHLNEDQEDFEGLWKETRVWRKVLSDKVVPIADDGCGNVYYLDFSYSPARVMFCDHDQDFAIFEVAPSFGDLIDSLRYDPDMI